MDTTICRAHAQKLICPCVSTWAPFGFFLAERVFFFADGKNIELTEFFPQITSIDC